MSGRKKFETQLQRAQEFHSKGHFKPAEALYQALLQSAPTHYPALYGLGTLKYQTGQYDNALKFLSLATQSKFASSSCWSNLAATHIHFLNYEQALLCLQNAIKLNPNDHTALNNYGLCLRLTGNLIKAEQILRELVKQSPKFDHFSNLVETLRLMGRYDEAERSCSLLINDGSPDPRAYTLAGNLEYSRTRFKEAVDYYRKALHLNNSLVKARQNLGVALRELGDSSGSLEAFEQAYSLEPDLENLIGDLLHGRLKVCHWQGFDALLCGVQKGLQIGKKTSLPFGLLALHDEPALHRKSAELYWGPKAAKNPIFDAAWPKSEGYKTGVAYFSADFHDHATLRLMAGFFEHHDRERFRVYAFSFGPDKNDAYRQRIKGCFDEFIDVRELSDAQVKQLCIEHQIDIAVDLKGFTQGARTGIFAQRCAPVQINYLGYPGTMGASFYDYIIADEVIIPPEYEKYYSEKVLRLPHCYQPNDRSRQVSDRVFTREELGLPKEGFVYCCFNNNYKILPETFDSWMRILKAVPGSVLWLLEDNAKASENLKKEAQSRGVDPSRLVFAPRMALPEHLARHRLADLFLDTFPYNAHTTASDALWVGLPILTRMGKSFASRVAASISKAAGLTELTTQTIQHYEALAIELANDHQRLNSIKNKLTQQLPTQPLYNIVILSEDFTRILPLCDSDSTN